MNPQEYAHTRLAKIDNRSREVNRHKGIMVSHHNFRSPRGSLRSVAEFRLRALGSKPTLEVPEQ